MKILRERKNQLVRLIIAVLLALTPSLFGQHEMDQMQSEQGTSSSKAKSSKMQNQVDGKTVVRDSGRSSVGPMEDGREGMAGDSGMMGHAGMNAQGHEEMQMNGMLGPYPMTREASGTSWQPEATPMDGIHLMAGGFP